MLSHEIAEGKVAVCGLTLGEIDRVAKRRLLTTREGSPAVHDVVKAVRHIELWLDERARHDGPSIDHGVVRTTFVVEGQVIEPTPTRLTTDVLMNPLSHILFE